MTIPLRSESQVEARLVQGAIPSQGFPPQTLQRHVLETRTPLSTSELAFRIFAAFRAHPHISNVLTHISHARWTEVERALNTILDPTASADALSPLEQNIVDLMCAERGVTGKILKPYFHAVLFRLTEPSGAQRLILQIEILFLELERKTAQPALRAASQGEHS